MAIRPDDTVFRGATRLITAMLASGSSPASRSLTADDLVAYLEEIATASGGILGLRMMSISAEERALLTRIASELKGRRR
jgi:hypothetical protein